MPSSPHHSGQTDPPAIPSSPPGNANPAVDASGAAVALRTGRCQCEHIVYQVQGVPDDPLVFLSARDADLRRSRGPLGRLRQGRADVDRSRW
jgi:hypothetical protein